jgi:uncharacterized protein (DUF924 family)
MNAQAEAILQFWFGDAPAARAEWFRKDAAFDVLIGERFGALIEQALRGAFESWADAPESALARILLLDQFTRNVFRDTPRAFAGDAQALSAARAMVARSQDRALPPLRRAFVYLPYEHAEDRTAQRESLALHAALAHDDPSLASQEEYARRHAEIVERFGRFPHRNLVLGRVSSDEELAFLQQPGSSF